MTVKVKLQDIMDELDFYSEESLSLINKQTGEIVYVSLADLRAAEEDELCDHLPEWKREARIIAIDIVENNDMYMSLPSRYDWNEYVVMEQFCLSITNTRLQNALLSAIHGKGAFRRFKDKLIDMDMEKEWYAFREEHMKQFIKEWCEGRGIEYTE